MTRRALLIAVVAVMACGRGAPEPYRTEITEPWSTMNLPLSEGRVVFSDEVMLTVHYDGGDVAGQTAGWSSALEAAGLRKKADTSARDMSSITWADDRGVVALGVLSAEGRAEVTLTRYPKRP